MLIIDGIKYRIQKYYNNLDSGIKCYRIIGVKGEGYWFDIFPNGTLKIIADGSKRYKKVKEWTLC